jgi:hypothetical protein
MGPIPTTTTLSKWVRFASLDLVTFLLFAAKQVETPSLQ